MFAMTIRNTQYTVVLILSMTKPHVRLGDLFFIVMYVLKSRFKYIHNYKE